MSYAFVGDRTLEVGCGTSRIYDLISRAGIVYTGLDKSPAMLQVFKERYPDTTMVEGDATKLPFEANSFELVMCFEVLRHLEDFQSVINEMYRVATRTVVFTIEVCEGESVIMGEARHEGYLNQRKEAFVHYQVVHNAPSFVRWLRQAFGCCITIRTITSKRYAFILHKDRKGYTVEISPVDGMHKLIEQLFLAVTSMGKEVKNETGKEVLLGWDFPVRA